MFETDLIRSIRSTLDFLVSSHLKISAWANACRSLANASSFTSLKPFWLWLCRSMP